MINGLGSHYRVVTRNSSETELSNTIVLLRKIDQPDKSWKYEWSWKWHAYCVLVKQVKPVEEWEAGPEAEEGQAKPFTWNHGRLTFLIRFLRTPRIQTRHYWALFFKLHSHIKYFVLFFTTFAFFDSLVAQTVKNLCNAGDPGSTPGLGRFP